MANHLMTFSHVVKIVIGGNITATTGMINFCARGCAQRTYNEHGIQSGPRNTQRWLVRTERYLSCIWHSTPLELLRWRVLDLLDVRNHIRHRH